MLYAIDSGNSGSAVTAADGTVFAPDQYFSGGSLGSTQDAIAGTIDDRLYQTERYGMFSYNFPVEAGTYDVSLYTVEPYYGANGVSGRRVFDVEVEGSVKLNDYDPMTSVGHDVANVIQINGVAVDDGLLSLEFAASTGEANIAAIAVRGLPGSVTPPVEPPPVSGTCAGNSYLLCLDFEDVAAGQRPSGFGVDGSASNVAVVAGAQAHSGTKALQVSSNGAGNYGYLTRTNFPANHWGRMYYKLGSVPSTGGYLHGTFVAAYGGGGEFRFVDTVQDPQGRHQYIYNTEPGDLSLQGAYDYSFDDQWVCVEWQMDASTQRWRFFREGTELAFTQNGQASNATNSSGFTPVPATLERIGFGLRFYQGNSGITGWLDDIAVGTSRIGCE